VTITVPTGGERLITLNFQHPLTDEQLVQIKVLTDHQIERIIDIPTQFDIALSFAEQASGLVDSIGLTSREWQMLPLLVNPPALNAIAVTVLAELHGRMGYFPPILRLRRIEGSVPPRFEVAEIINLQAVRDAARAER
jgi:hypothetical protein